MILNSVVVEQTIDRDVRGRFVKELVLVRVPSKSDPDGIPLAMIRKRDAEAGGGTLGTVVLLHGYGQNRYAWHLPSRSVFNHLVRAGFDVFNLELRGHGRSRHLGARPPGNVADFVREDVPAAIEVVQKIAGPGPVFLVGHSLGGLVAYASAANLRGAIGGVATLGSPYQFTHGSWALEKLGTAMLALDRRMSFGEGGVELKPIMESVRLLRGFVESPIFPLPIRGFAPGSLEPQVLSQHMSLAMDVGSVAVLRNMFLSAAEARRGGHCLGQLTGYADEFEALVDLPLLVVAGTRDDLAPPASVEPAYLRSRSRDRTYRTFPRGHLDLLVGQDAPQTIWPLLETWLKKRARALRPVGQAAA